MKNPIQKHIIPIALAALFPAVISAAPSKITIGFDTDGNLEGFTSTNVTGLATAGGLISGTASTGDPRIIKATGSPTSTPIFSKPVAAAWQTIKFRVRETADPLTPGTVVNTFSATGLAIQLNSTNGTSGATTIGSALHTAGAIDVDGFFVVTADISSYTANDIRYFRLDPIGDTDAAGNKFEVDYIEINLTNTPPALVSTSPADGATGVAPTANLVATFDEPVSLNTTGTITIKNLTTTTDTVISLPGPDPDGTLSVIGNQLTIDPTANLGVPGDELAIEISADAIKDADGTFYAGILSTDVPNWSFTIDNIPPPPNYFHPITATAKAPLDGSLFIVFNEAVVKGTGNLVLHKADNSVVETIDVTSGNVSVSGSRVTITPTVPLAYGTSYYVLIDSGAIADALGNAYAGISDSAAWAFSTIASDSTILFGDSFNRANDTNLNATAAGKYGSLGALNYTSRVIGVGNVQLSAGQLLAQSNEAAGQSGGLVYINDHNFTDAAISSGGGFSITVDINAYSTEGSGRYLSVGVGQSLAELDAQATANITNSAGDLVVGYRNTTSGAGVYVFKNGTLDSSQTGSLPAPPTKMRIDYSLSNFNTGSTVNYGVFFDDSVTAYKTGTFTWSGTNENYISLSSNLFQDTTAGTRYALFDNFQIRKLGSGGGSGFDTWKTANSTTGGLNDDHDGDGVSNGVEYFLVGPNGISTGFTPLPSVLNIGGTLSVTWTKDDDYTGTYETDFVVETSETLTGVWIEEEVPPAVGATVTISGNNVTYTFPAPLGSKKFARLKVTGP